MNMQFSEELLDLGQKLLNLASKNKIKIVTAESCSGGLLSALITCASGSSFVFDCGFVTYSNEAKHSLLGVRNKSLEQFGAVSQEVADEMAIGAIKNSRGDLSVSITGIAGPTSDDTKKKVGLVYISAFNKKTQKLISKRFEFDGTRDQIRFSSITHAINLLIESIKNEAH